MQITYCVLLPTMKLNSLYQFPGKFPYVQLTNQGVWGSHGVSQLLGTTLRQPVEKMKAFILSFTQEDVLEINAICS